MSLKWPILCRVGCKTTTQSINYVVCMLNWAVHECSYVYLHVVDALSLPVQLQEWHLTCKKYFPREQGGGKGEQWANPDLHRNWCICVILILLCYWFHATGLFRIDRQQISRLDISGWRVHQMPTMCLKQLKPITRSTCRPLLEQMLMLRSFVLLKNLRKLRKVGHLYCWMWYFVAVVIWYFNNCSSLSVIQYIRFSAVTLCTGVGQIEISEKSVTMISTPSSLASLKSRLV